MIFVLTEGSTSINAPALLMNIGIRKIGSGPAAIVSSIWLVMIIALAWLVLGKVLTVV